MLHPNYKQNREMTKKVAIIGAGSSGLTAIKCCLEEGLEPVCYEKTNDIGGLWCFRENKNVGSFTTSTVYRSTVTNTSKEIMAFSDFPMPKEYPNYLQNEYVNEYLNLYADKFNLKRHIVFNTNVKIVSQTDDYVSTGCWTLALESQDGRICSETFDAVLVCSGHYDTPNLINFPGMDDFEGDVLHTKYYKRPIGYDDKRVLVIGIGNSACDVAVELARITSKLYLSTREGTWVTPRLHERGLPIDLVLSRGLLLLPHRLREWHVQRMVNNRLDHTIFNVKPKHGIFDKSVTVNDELPYHIANGNIVIKPNIKAFRKTGVEFEDGTYAQIDTVIMGTGYKFSFPVDSSAVKVNETRVHLYRNVFPPDLKHPSLAIIGLTTQTGPVNPICEMQCRWVTRLIKGICKLPSKDEMERHISEYKVDLMKKGVDIKTDPFRVELLPYLDEIANEIGVKPQIGKLFFRNPLMAFKVFFGPLYPYQYRLIGPGKWDGAKEAMETAWDRVIGAYQTRKVPKDELSRHNICLKTVIVAVFFTGMIYACDY